MATIADLRQVVSETKKDESVALTRELLAAGLDPMEILEDGVVRRAGADAGIPAQT